MCDKRVTYDAWLSFDFELGEFRHLFLLIVSIFIVELAVLLEFCFYFIRKEFSTIVAFAKDCREFVVERIEESHLREVLLLCVLLGEHFFTRDNLDGVCS